MAEGNIVKQSNNFSGAVSFNPCKPFVAKIRADWMRNVGLYMKFKTCEKSKFEWAGSVETNLNEVNNFDNLKWGLKLNIDR